jgi:hypothetical protein
VEEEVAGVALVRVWAAADTPDRLLVRIVAVDQGRQRPIGVASSVASATALLKGWLESLIDDRSRREAALPPD